MQTHQEETSQLPLNDSHLSAVIMMKPRAGGSRGGLRVGCKRLLLSSAENLAAAPRSAAAIHCGLGKSGNADDVLAHTSRDGETEAPVQAMGLSYKYSTRVAMRKERATSVERAAAQTVLNQAEKEEAVKKMHCEFARRRTALLTGLPANCREEELNAFLQNYSSRAVSKIKEGTVSLLFHDTSTAREQMLKLSACFYKGCKLTASFGHPNSLLFVGNLPSTYTSDDLHRLFRCHGHILRCFIVCSLSTGLSKGYAFVEFERRDEASQAKLLLATKVVGSRSLRVDFADNGMQICEDLHSQTLFVDRLPKGFTEDETLRRVFAKYGTVNFCQVAVSPSGASRGFAFIDMSTWQEAEEAWGGCNGTSLSGYEIRVSFGMPCRPGACILQHKAPITLQFPVCGRSLVTPVLPQKENIPVEFTVDFLPQAPPNSCHQFVLPSMTSTLYKPPTPPCSLSLQIPTSTLSTFSTFSTSTIPPLPTSTIPPLPTPTLSFLPTSLPPLTPLSPSSAPRHSSNQHWSRSEANTTIHVSRKRSAAEAEHVTSDPFVLLGGVYYQPYIGQHQQGLPFTHPLKRIKMEN